MKRFQNLIQRILQFTIIMYQVNLLLKTYPSPSLKKITTAIN